MSRTKAAEFAENVEFPSFDASRTADQFRVFAERGVEQSKEAYTKFKAGAEEAHKALESTYETGKTLSSDLSLKTIGALRANAEANFSHFEAIVGAKSLSEIIELQTAFLRKRVELGVEQAKDLQATATKAVEDAAKPLKAFFEKAVHDAKIA